uniref:Uncharacterized protein n=1 Tax=Anguilla anguilla TaxID=7936 RepID=A0A0E9Q354_ANGAN
MFETVFACSQLMGLFIFLLSQSRLFPECLVFLDLSYILHCSQTLLMYARIFKFIRDECWNTKWHRTA